MEWIIFTSNEIIIQSFSFWKILNLNFFLNIRNGGKNKNWEATWLNSQSQAGLWPQHMGSISIQHAMSKQTCECTHLKYIILMTHNIWVSLKYVLPMLLNITFHMYRLYIKIMHNYWFKKTKKRNNKQTKIKRFIYSMP